MRDYYVQLGCSTAVLPAARRAAEGGAVCKSQRPLPYYSPFESNLLLGVDRVVWFQYRYTVTRPHSMPQPVCGARNEIYKIAPTSDVRSDLAARGTSTSDE